EESAPGIALALHLAPERAARAAARAPVAAFRVRRERPRRLPQPRLPSARRARGRVGPARALARALARAGARRAFGGHARALLSRRAALHPVRGESPPRSRRDLPRAHAGARSPRRLCARIHAAGG